MAAEQQSTCTNQDLMVAVLKLQEEVKRMGNLLDNQKERKEYHKAYYQRRKADALAKAEAERASAREACEDLKAVLESMKGAAEGPTCRAWARF